MTRESLAVSFFILAAATITAITRDKGESSFIRTATVITAVYALLGFIALCTEGRRGNDILEKLQDYSSVLIPLIVVPCVVTELWLKTEMFQVESAYAHTAIGTAFSLLIILGCGQQDLINVLVVISMVSLVLPGVMSSNLNAVWAALFFSCAHFGVTCLKVKVNNRDIPFDDLYNYCMIGFGYFSLKAVVN